MTFSILFNPKAAKFIRKLAPEIKERVKSKIKELAEFPEKGKSLKYSNFYSLRMGDHRIIYELDKEEKSVIVLFAGHRKNVYDNFSKLF